MKRGLQIALLFIFCASAQAFGYKDLKGVVDINLFSMAEYIHMDSTIIFRPGDLAQEANDGYLSFGFGGTLTAFDIFYVGAEMHVPTEFKSLGPGGFSPKELKSVFKTGAIWKNFELGYVWECSHTVAPNQKNNRRRIFRDKNLGKFFVRVDLEL